MFIGGQRRDFSDLLEETILKIEQWEDDVLIFHTKNWIFGMEHWHECCENVYIESITGDFKDLIGSKIIRAAEEVFMPQDDPRNDLVRWTFYKLATQKGYVDIRWYGCSNGYYGVEVKFFVISDKKYKEAKENLAEGTKITIFD